MAKKENLFRENICFSGLEPCKLMQLTIFHFFKRCNLYIRYEGMCDLTNTIKPPIQYIWTDYTDIQTDYWEKVRYAQNINIFIDHFI